MILDGIPADAGPARERWILDRVIAGHYDPIAWATLEFDHRGHSYAFSFAADALKIDGVRVSVSHRTAQRIADLLGFWLPTPKICDLIHASASVVLRAHPQTPDATMDDTAVMVAYSRLLDREIDDRLARGGHVSTIGKDWVNTNRLLGRPDLAANYGMHDRRAPNGKVWQSLGTRHNPDHADYAQLVRAIARRAWVDGAPIDIAELAAHPEHHSAISDEGPLRVLRHPGVALEASLAEVAPQSKHEPPSAVTNGGPPTLRRGSTGPDVRRWQAIVGATADGAFGPKTEAATKAWQGARGLAATGVVDAASWAAATATATQPVSSKPATTKPSGVQPDDASVTSFVQARHYTKGPRTKGPITLVVIHDMEAAETTRTAENVAAWAASAGAAESSFHYALDSDSTVQCVLERDIAWHAPGANHNGVGVELAGYARQTAAEWADAFSTAMIDRAARLVAGICRRHGIPVTFVDAASLQRGERGITTHHEVTKAFKRSTHWDPGPNFPMARFLALVQAAD